MKVGRVEVKGKNEQRRSKQEAVRREESRIKNGTSVLSNRITSN